MLNQDRAHVVDDHRDENAGDSLTSVAADFGVPVADVEDILRVAFPIAA